MVDTNGAPDLESLSAWQTALSRQVQDLQSDIRAKQSTLAKVEERLLLVTKLIDVETRTANDKGEPIAKTQVEASRPRMSSDKATGSGAPPDLEQAVEEILRTAGAPLHISVIRAELIEQQVPIPGRGDDANIIVRLRRFEDRFTRTARGTYALAEWGLPALASKTRKRRRVATR